MLKCFHFPHIPPRLEAMILAFLLPNPRPTPPIMPNGRCNCEGERSAGSSYTMTMTAIPKTMLEENGRAHLPLMHLLLGQDSTLTPWSFLAKTQLLDLIRKVLRRMSDKNRTSDLRLVQQHVGNSVQLPKSLLLDLIRY